MKYYIPGKKTFQNVEEKIVQPVVFQPVFPNKSEN